MKDKLKESIIKANPSILDRVKTGSLNGEKNYVLTLADVLIALEKAGKNYAVDYEGEFIRFFKKDDSGCMIPHWEDVYWNLEHNNLDWHIKNESKTIKFLEDLLT